MRGATVRGPLRSPDWARLVADLTSRMSLAEVAGRLWQVGMTDQLLRHYVRGGQPNYFRGRLLLDLWCCVMRQAQKDAPMVNVAPCHRASRSVARGPRLQRLPDWPR